MDPETARRDSYFELLKEYLDIRLEGVSERFGAITRATDIAYETMEKRLDGMNEFRDTLRDQAGRFVTTSTLDAKIAVVESDLRLLRDFKASLEGKASQQSVMVGYVLSVIGIILSIISLISKFI